MSKYSISLANSDEAKKFWNLSPNATAFTNPEIMNFFNYNFEWQTKRGEEVLCMWPVCLESKSKVVLPERVLPNIVYKLPFLKSKETSFR